MKSKSGPEKSTHYQNGEFYNGDYGTVCCVKCREMAQKTYSCPNGCNGNLVEITDKQKKIYDKAIEVCQKFDEFHSSVFSFGFPLEINGKQIDHTLLNEIHDLTYNIFQELKEGK